MIRAAAMTAVLAVVAASCGTPEALRVGAGDSLVAAVAKAEPGSVIELGAGRYAGPIEITRPLTIVGGAGVIIEAPLDTPGVLIRSDDVVLRDVIVEGGRSGIAVIDAERVELSNIAVKGAEWHGIFVENSEVDVSDCSISGLLAPLPQGFEIRNSDARPASRVEACIVQGPVFEGIVAHVSHVTFENNSVFGSFERGIVITEMSDGRMEGNVVEGVEGNAFFCGDMSRCSVVDNVARGVDSSGTSRSGEGHGLVVQYHSEAFVEGLETVGLAGEPVLVMLDGALSETSVYP